MIIRKIIVLLMSFEPTLEHNIIKYISIERQITE